MISLRRVELTLHDSLLRVQNVPLPVTNHSSTYRSERGYKGEECGSIFKPMFIVLLGVLTLAGGIWMMMFTARNRGCRAWIIGAGLASSGYALSLFGGVGFGCHIAENASASFGSFCALASCYDDSENIEVVLILIAPFELHDITADGNRPTLS